MNILTVSGGVVMFAVVFSKALFDEYTEGDSIGVLHY